MFKTLNKNDILRGLESILPKDIIKVDEPLKRYTYTETGGEADFYLSPTKNEEVQAIVKFAHENSIPVTYLGNGSNIIIREGGIRGIVLSLLSLNHIETSDDAIIAGSGAAIIDVSNVARDHVLTGLEFACGIPGSIGGAVFMNAGAYGGEVKDCIDYALCVNEKGDLLKLTTAELELDYRNSVVQQKHLVVLELEFPSCGSVFQRPPGHFAGKLIQDSNLQGYRIGGVEVSTKHAGFMVNVDNGTATDYEALIHHVQKIVKEKFDVELNTEVRIIGDHPTD